MNNNFEHFYIQKTKNLFNVMTQNFYHEWTQILTKNISKDPV